MLLERFQATEVFGKFTGLQGYLIGNSVSPCNGAIEWTLNTLSIHKMAPIQSRLSSHKRMKNSTLPDLSFPPPNC